MKKIIQLVCVLAASFCQLSLQALLIMDTPDTRWALKRGTTLRIEGLLSRYGEGQVVRAREDLHTENDVVINYDSAQEDQEIHFESQIIYLKESVQQLANVMQNPAEGYIPGGTVITRGLPEEDSVTTSEAREFVVVNSIFRGFSTEEESEKRLLLIASGDAEVVQDDEKAISFEENDSIIVLSGTLKIKVKNVMAVGGTITVASDARLLIELQDGAELFISDDVRVSGGKGSVEIIGGEKELSLAEGKIKVTPGRGEIFIETSESDESSMEEVGESESELAVPAEGDK